MKFLVLLVLLGTIHSIYGHSYLSTPITRSNQRQTQSGCRNGCGPCDPGSPSSNPTTVARGATIQIQWPRNNHPGGFIRYSWAPTSSSSSQASFDAGIDSYFCFEIPASTCKSSSSDPLGGDSGAQFNCGNDITVPLWVTDGRWTMQWIWYGGIYNLGEYRSCVDYQVTGGPSSATIPTPVFYGGDAHYPNENACMFANVNTAHACEEPCSGPFPNAKPQKGVPSAPHIANLTGQTVTASSTASAATSSSASASATSSSASASATSSSASATATSSSASATATSTASGNVGLTTKAFVQMTTSPNDFAFIQGPSAGMCPNPAAPNLNGEIKHPPTCGRLEPGSRCPDGQCCSQDGVCGPVPDPDGLYRAVVQGVTQIVTYQEALAVYCNNNQGDWSYIPCSNSNMLTYSILVFIASFLFFI